MKFLHYFSIIALFFMVGCETAPKKPELTPLQIQSIQTREYEWGKDMIFPSVISVFQDLGYSITNADKDTGLIHAESATESNSAADQFWTGVAASKQTKATAFVDQIGDKTTLRLSFVSVLNQSNAYGQGIRSDQQILDAKLYENAFNRIDTAIFVRRSAN